MSLIVEQMKASEGVTEELKTADQMAWVGAMNSIRNRAEEIILREMIYGEDVVRESSRNFGTAISSRLSMTHLPTKSTRKKNN